MQGVRIAMGTSNDSDGTYDFKHCGKTNFIAGGKFVLPLVKSG